MANTSDLGTCLATDEGRSELLPLSPFNALHYHFGMLLGVDDFETEQAYHRAKLRLHNAWLHREGVVWGFGVKRDEQRGEIRVRPGLALDAAGHELHLEAEACVSLVEWFEKHKADADFKIESEGDKRKFDAHVVIRFKACLTRQVPAMMEPCDNAGTGTAYSRVFETVEILLLPNQAPKPVYPYHRLRLMFGLEEPVKVDQAKLDDLVAKEHLENFSEEDRALLWAVRRDRTVLDEVTRIEALAASDQPVDWLQAFHRFAALDEIDLQPARSEDGARTLLFPGREDEAVVLANINGITLARNNDGWVTTDGIVDTSVRQSHVATTTIQDLLCGGFLSDTAGPGSGHIGPRIDPGTVAISDSQIVLHFDKPLQPASVKPDAFSVSLFDVTTGWSFFGLNASVDSGFQMVTLKPAFEPPEQAPVGTDTESINNSEAKLEAISPAKENYKSSRGKPVGPRFRRGLIRIIARGTGPSPLLGKNNLALAGATNQRVDSQGADFVLMKERN